MADTHSISIVIPTHNSSGHIRETIQAVATLTESFSLLQIVIVDDGSSDDTFDAVQKAFLELPSVAHTAVELATNVGQSAATAIGLAHADGELVVSLDDDLSYPVKEIPKLVDALAENLDFVVGAPSSYANSLPRRIASRLVRWLGNKAFRTPPHFIFSSFVCYRKSFVARLKLPSQPVERIGWMFSLSARYVNVPIDTAAGLRKLSNYSFIDLLRTARPVLLPLLLILGRALRWVAMLIVLIALLLSARYLNLAVSGKLLPGFATTVVLLLFNIAISSMTFSQLLTTRNQIAAAQHNRVFHTIRRVIVHRNDNRVKS